MPVIEATDADFLPLLAAHDKVVVKYYADWCGSCRLLAPGFARLAAQPENEAIAFLKVNSEFNPVARRLSGVSYLPFFAAFRAGLLVSAGPANQEAAVQAFINTLTEAAPLL
jgi:thioredoxin 1